MLTAHWQPAGYTAPNSRVYPWQWLWDSCFHALIWAELGDAERALAELTQALSAQDDCGFVPHVNYHGDRQVHATFWGRPGVSSITQPPMYGHALAELARRGVAVAESLVVRAVAGIEFLMQVRARDLQSGLILLCHPWESGADNSARWDALCPPEFTKSRWYEIKGELVASLSYGHSGSPVANARCAVASAEFNALVAFNALELAQQFSVDRLAGPARELIDALDSRWDRELATWVDAGVTHATSGRARTSEALLPVLVSRDEVAVDTVFALLRDDAAYGAPFGPAGAHRDEPTFRPDEYWRGAAWPQINYLLWTAARRRGRVADATALAATTVAGMWRSGLAEYWHPDVGQGLGATPQSWTGLAVVIEAGKNIGR